MSEGTNNFKKSKSNGKSAIEIEFLIDHKAYLTSSKRKSCVKNTKSQATLAPFNVASLDAKQPRENAQKGSADD